MPEDRGWIALQSWFEVLIEPWIDWTIARHDLPLCDQLLTFNRIPFDTRSQSPLNPLSLPKSPQRKVLKAMGARGRKTPPPKSEVVAPTSWQEPRAGAAVRRQGRLASVGAWRAPAPGYANVERAAQSPPKGEVVAPTNWQEPWAGAAERRQERLASIGAWRAPAPGYANVERATQSPPIAKKEAVAPTSWQGPWAGAADRRQERLASIGAWRAPAPSYANVERAAQSPPKSEVVAPSSWQEPWAGAAERRQERLASIGAWRAPASGYGSGERAAQPPPPPPPLQSRSYAPRPVRHQHARTRNYTRLPDISIPENQAFRMPTNSGAGMMLGVHVGHPAAAAALAATPPSSAPALAHLAPPAPGERPSVPYPHVFRRPHQLLPSALPPPPPSPPY